MVDRSKQSRFNEKNFEHYEPKGIPEYPQNGSFSEKFCWVFKTRYVRNLLWCLIYLVLVLFVTGVVLVVAYEKRPPPPLLPDVFHDSIPYVPGITMVNVAMALVIVAGVIQMLWPLRLSLLIILRRVSNCYATIMLLRDFTVFFTSLPDPNPACPKDWNFKFNLYPSTFFKFLLGGASCGDMIFSGHTIALLLPVLVVQHYYPGWLQYLMWVLIIFIAFMIVICRLHYTVDVILSFIIFPGVWWIYHAVAEHPEAFADQLPAPISWFFENIEWNNPYFLTKVAEGETSDDENEDKAVHDV